MKRKIMAVTLTAAMLAGLAAVPVWADDTGSDEGKVLNIYCWNEEFKSRLTDHYPGYEEVDGTHGKIGDVDVVWNITPSDDNAYQNNLDETLLKQADASADDKIDLFLVEADYALKYVNTDYTMPVADLGITEDEVADQYQYTKDVMTDADGNLKGLSWQGCPGTMIYRRDIAKEVFGTDDPDEVGKIFKDYPTILETAQTLKDAGYRIFSSDAEMNVFSGDSAWVVDGTLNVDQSRIDYMDLCVDLYQNDLTAYASQWSTPWYQAMAGEVPILTADIQSNADDSVNVWDADQFAEATKGLDTTTVFAFGLPSWGVLTMRDNVGETSGLWGVCSGPAAGFDGGTYIGISSQSERKDTACL